MGGVLKQSRLTKVIIYNNIRNCKCYRWGVNDCIYGSRDFAQFKTSDLAVSQSRGHYTFNSKLFLTWSDGWESLHQKLTKKHVIIQKSNGEEYKSLLGIFSIDERLNVDRCLMSEWQPILSARKKCFANEKIFKWMMC